MVQAKGKRVRSQLSSCCRTGSSCHGRRLTYPHRDTRTQRGGQREAPRRRYGDHFSGVFALLCESDGKGRGGWLGQDQQPALLLCLDAPGGAVKAQIQGFRGSSSWDGAAGVMGSGMRCGPGWNIGLDKQTACHKTKSASTPAFPSLPDCHNANWQLGPPSQSATATQLPRGHRGVLCACEHRLPDLTRVLEYSVVNPASARLCFASPQQSVEPVSSLGVLPIHGGGARLAAAAR